jgi:hypothetical protein
MLSLTSYIYKGSCPADVFVRGSQEDKEIGNRKKEDRSAEE